MTTVVDPLSHYNSRWDLFKLSGFSHYIPSRFCFKMNKMFEIKLTFAIFYDFFYNIQFHYFSLVWIGVEIVLF